MGDPTRRANALDARPYGLLHLPVTRSNEGLTDDQAFVDSALEQVRQLSRYTSFTAETQILDFGCGQGRFAIGLLLSELPFEGYCGIDTSEASIDWCRQWLKARHSRLDFRHVPAHNARYNPSVEGRPPLPVHPGFFDIAFLNSVFTHMLPDDVLFYLEQLNRALKPDGLLYLTAFLEDGVPEVEENPAGYLRQESAGALHRVRYKREFFTAIVEGAGLRVIDLLHRGILRTDQSVLVARRIG